METKVVNIFRERDESNIPAQPISDIPANLRRLAAQIEAGEIKPDFTMVITKQGREVVTYGFGDEVGKTVSVHEAHGILAHAMKIVASNF